MELYERAVTARTHPPTPGPTWIGIALSSAERERAGRKLREWRLERGMTLAQVSEATGFTPQKLERIENRGQLIRPAELVELARGLEIDLLNYLTGSGP